MFPEFKDATVHGQRRWFYGLWAGLLALAAAAYVLWEKPAALEHTKIQMTLVVPGTPPGTRARVWAGSVGALRRTGPNELLQAAPDIEFSGYARLPDVPVQIARRRWVKATIPGRTTEAVIVRLSAPGEAPRFFFYDLRMDVEDGFLKDRALLSLTMTLAWNRLNPDPKAFSRVR